MLAANAATGALAVLAVVLFAGTPPAHGSLHCATVADFVKISNDINAECCDEKTESCGGGVPASCNPGCAAVLVPAYIACTAEGGYLAQPFMSGTEVVFAKAAAMCGRRADGHSASPLLKCATLNDYNTIARDVTAECCDEESCTSGLPTTCDAGCAAVLLPAEKACTMHGGWFDHPQYTQIKTIYHKAAALCKKQSQNGGGAGECPLAQFAETALQVDQVCCTNRALRVS